MIYKIFSQSSFKNKTINSSRHVNQKSSKQVFILLFEGSNKRRACPQMIAMYQWKIPWRTKVRKKVTYAITFHGIKFHHCCIIVFWQILWSNIVDEGLWKIRFMSCNNLTKIKFSCHHLQYNLLLHSQYCFQYTAIAWYK